MFRVNSWQGHPEDLMKPTLEVPRKHGVQVLEADDDCHQHVHFGWRLRFAYAARCLTGDMDSSHQMVKKEVTPDLGLRKV